MLQNDQNMKFVNRIREKAKFNFSDITKSISQGIVTGNNSVYILDDETLNSRNIEMIYLKPVFKGKDIRNGMLINNKQYLFYPYNIDSKGNNVLINEIEIENNNPNLYEYLIEKKSELLSREYFLKSKKQWYELWNPRKKIHFMNRKFVFSEVNDRNDFALCDECFYSDSACGAELKESFLKYETYIQKYLNSHIISELYRKISVPKANGYLIYKNAFLKDLPIYIPEDIEFIYNELISLSDEDFNDWLINKLNQ